MFFVVFNIKTKEFYYRNYLLKGYIDINFETILSKIKRGEYTFNTEQHQLAFLVKNNVVFGAVRLCEGARIARDDNIWNKKIDLKTIYNIVKRFSKILTDQEINQLKENRNGTSVTMWNNRIKEHFYPNLTQIFLFGNEGTGLDSIMYFWLGFTRTQSSINTHIPIDKTFHNHNIMFIRPKIGTFFPRLDQLANKQNNIICIIDSTKNLTLNHNLKALQNGKSNSLIIANKQDLPGAVSPKKIEEISGISTAGFSTVAPEASIRLERILTDFLKISK